MTEILMSDEVRQLLGAEGAARVREIPLTGGHCPACRRSLPADGPVTVLLVCSGTVTNAAFAHPGCLASQVLPAPDGAATRDEQDMTMDAVLLGHEGVMLPTLLAELVGAAYVGQSPGSGGDLTNLLVSATLERGFELVTHLDDVPAVAPGWSATLAPGADGLAGLHIREPGGGTLYDGHRATTGRLAQRRRALRLVPSLHRRHPVNRAHRRRGAAHAAPRGRRRRADRRPDTGNPAAVSSSAALYTEPVSAQPDDVGLRRVQVRRRDGGQDRSQTQGHR